MKYFVIILSLLFNLEVKAQTELISNGDFSTPNFAWATSGNFQYDSRFTNYHSPPAYSYLADFAGQPANNISGQLFQNFFVPSTTDNLSIILWFRITTNETTVTSVKDSCIVTLVDPANSANNILIKQFSNLDKNSTYSKITVNIPSLQVNQNWRLLISGFTDASLPTVFRFDDISVIANPATNSNCITWVNNVFPTPGIKEAMEILCNYGIISSNQNASEVNSLISKIELARCLSKALLGSDELTFLDNFPNLYPAVESLPLADQRVIKLMLFLEYKDKGFPPSENSDDISPFPREYFYGSYNGSINKSDAIKATLETWDLAPSMINYNASGNTTSPVICDMLVSHKNLGWVERAHVLGYLSNNITTPCISQSVNFGPDNGISYAQFYVMLARQLNVPKPIVGYDDFYKPNLFYTNNLDRQSSEERWVFHEYSDNGFNIPSGGFSLQFTHSYHSNLTEIPVLDSDQDQAEDTYLKPKLQPLGGGWTHPYSTFIKVLDNNGSPPEKILIYWADGTIHSFLVQQNRYENKGITDKLFIDSVNNFGHPAIVRIQKGRTVYLFKNIDNVGYRVLSLLKITDAHNNTLTLDYIQGYGTVSGYQPMVLSKVTDNFSGRFLSFSYWPGTNYLNTVTDPANRVLKFYVNQYTHDLDSSADAKNQVTKYIYSVNAGTNAYRTHLLVYIQKPKGNNITNSYNRRKLNQTQNANYIVTINPPTPDYSNPWSQQIVNVTTIKNNQTLVSKHTFNSNGDLSNLINESDSTQILYDTANRPIIVRDLRRGFIRRFEYDNNGYLKKDVTIDSLYNDSTKNEYTNNQFGEVTNIKDYNDPSNTFTHDIKITRNSEGDPTSVVEFDGTPGKVEYIYGYQNGLVSYFQTPVNDNYQITYNSFGNPINVSHCNQSNNCVSSTTAYDNISRPVSSTDFNGKITTLEYDVNDNLKILAKDPSGLNLKTQYEYDQNDNLVSVISPKGHITTLVHDFSTDDLIEENDGVNKKKWRYNQDGSLDSFINKNNTIFKYLYYNQALFPNTKFDGYLFSDGNSFFHYEDITKELNNVSNSLGKNNYFGQGSNHRGKWNKPILTNTTGFFNGPTDFVFYEYDRMMRPTSIAYPVFGGKNYSFSNYYDNITRNLSFVQDNNNFKNYITYSYQKDGKVLTEIYYNGDTIFHHYDYLNREDSIWGKNKINQLLYSVGATLDNNGKHIRENTRIFYEGQEVTTLPALNLGEIKTYSYELRNRIITGDNKSYTSNGSGEITTATPPPVTYTWSDVGQLTNVNRNGVNTIYEYDPLGNRKRKDNIYYVVDQQNTGNIIMEANQNTAPISAYIYGNGLVCRIDAITDSIFYYHYDMRGSVIAITDQNGQMVQYYKYDPFGVVYNKAGTITWTNPFQYLGKHGVQADNNDLYYLKSRYYQPSTGRFVSEDPVWNANLFIYGDDDPINRIDPYGEKSKTLEIFNNSFSQSVQIAKNSLGDPNNWKLAWDLTLLFATEGFSEFNPSIAASRAFEVGPYNTLRGVEEGLEAHHVGQRALMKKLIPDYNPNTAPSILVPKQGHTLGQGILARGTSGFANVSEVLARDIFELKRVYPNIPERSLQQLIQLNKSMYPGSF